jgi:3-dehydroquinate dehydratase-2
MVAKSAKASKGSTKKSKQSSLRILVANGVNLDLLGSREPDVYGTQTLEEMNREIEARWSEVAAVSRMPAVELHFFQTNHEGIFLEALDANWDGIVINPGAWTHTSLALADRIKGLNVPCAEVHLSNIFAREAIRHESLCSSVVVGLVAGFGAEGYVAALFGLVSTQLTSRPQPLPSRR